MAKRLELLSELVPQARVEGWPAERFLAALAEHEPAPAAAGALETLSAVP